MREQIQPKIAIVFWFFYSFPLRILSLLCHFCGHLVNHFGEKLWDYTPENS